MASVGDSRCILVTPGGELSLLTVDHRLDDNEDEVNRVRASGGEVGRLNICGGQEVWKCVTVFCFFFIFLKSVAHSPRCVAWENANYHTHSSDVTKSG